MLEPLEHLAINMQIHVHEAPRGNAGGRCTGRKIERVYVFVREKKKSIKMPSSKRDEMPQEEGKEQALGTRATVLLT